MIANNQKKMGKPKWRTKKNPNKTTKNLFYRLSKHDLDGLPHGGIRISSGEPIIAWKGLLKSGPHASPCISSVKWWHHYQK